jgi:16S rRNA (uracil1498-N3)-methyltransferase
MASTRLFVNDTLGSGIELQLGREQAHYLGRVLRLHNGDALTVFNGDNGEFDARVTSLAKNSATVVVDAPVQTATESALKTHLVQGISRGDRMDFVVQKATELGVKRITPVFTEYGVVKLDQARAAKRIDHWQSVAISACEQSGRIRPPLIDGPIDLNSWFGAGAKEADTDLILRPGAAIALSSIAAPVTKVCLLIGPEGGFSETEYEDATIAGFAAVSLGPRVLRTETAALTAIAVAQTLWGDLRAEGERR